MSNDPDSAEHAAEILSGDATEHEDVDVDVDGMEQTLQDAEGGIEGSALEAGDS